MKKLILIGISVLLIISTVVFGTVHVFENQGKEQILNDLQQTVSENTLIEQIKQQENEQTVQNDFVILAQQMITKYHMTNEEINYLAGLYEQGYDLEWLCRIFSFYVTCGEDISIIKSIYDTSIEQEIEDQFWVENAYNAVTNNIHGVLDTTQVMEYYQKGIDSTQILMANELCRKGVYTIYQILDKRVEGIEWSQIINEVLGTNISDTEGKSVENLMIEKKITERAGVSQGLASNVVQSSNQIQLMQTPETASRYDSIKNALIEMGVTQEKIAQLEQDGYAISEIYNAKKVSENKQVDFDEVLRLYRDKGKWSKLIDKEVDLS